MHVARPLATWLTALLAWGALCLSASAATLYISEYANGLSQVGTTQPQVLPQAAIADQTVALSGTSAQSAAFNSKTHAVDLICDEGCSVVFGNGTSASPVATTANYMLQQGVHQTFVVAPGTVLAVIANAAGNSSGGGGGPITAASGSYAAGAFSVGAGSNGWDIAEGATSDAACSTATGTCSIIALMKYLNTAVGTGVGTPGSAVPATGLYLGGNVAGNFRGWTGVNPSGSIYAQQSDLSSIAGTTVDTNSGNKSAGTQRVVLATDQPNLTTPLNTKSVSTFGAAQLSSAVVSAASSGDNTLVTRSVGTVKIYGLFFSCASSVVATLKNGASTGVTGAMTLTTFFLPIQAEPYFTTTSTNNFVMNLGSAVQCSGTVYYLDN